jgi:3-oxoacyl-[acyl-carrier protein] reductase
MLLEGRAAVVTGAAQGIGFAIAKTLGAHGASVVVADIDGARAEAAAERLRADGRAASAVRCDVSDEDDVNGLVAACLDEHGRIDVMVNNAGITRDATMRKMTADDFDTVVRVHLRGAWLGTRAASLEMRERGGGSIVNMSSVSGKIGIVGQTNYSAAKAGIVGLTKAAAKEVGHAGVRVNAVQPGLIRTPMTAAMPQDMFAEREKQIPLQRAGEPGEVADAVLFLASGMSSYITGAVIEVGGGRGI